MLHGPMIARTHGGFNMSDTTAASEQRLFLLRSAVTEPVCFSFSEMPRLILHFSLSGEMEKTQTGGMRSSGSFQTRNDPPSFFHLWCVLGPTGTMM
jgi:hypothetical protein